MQLYSSLSHQISVPKLVIFPGKARGSRPTRLANIRVQQQIFPYRPRAARCQARDYPENHAFLLMPASYSTSNSPFRPDRPTVKCSYPSCPPWSRNIAVLIHGEMCACRFVSRRRILVTTHETPPLRVVVRHFSALDAAKLEGKRERTMTAVEVLRVEVSRVE